MNLIVLTGRLTKEPEVRYTQSGKTVCSFSIAVDRPFSGQDGKREADFFNCMLWGKQGETFGNTVHKGHKILVEGRVQISSYQLKTAVNASLRILFATDLSIWNARKTNSKHSHCQKIILMGSGG